MVEFVDKRKLNSVGEAIEPIADLPKEAAPEVVLEVGNDAWKEVAYMSGVLQQPNGQIQIGKAIGIRGDDRVFDVDYVFPMVWREDENWQTIAKQRLDSFLGCSCSELGVCNMHTMLQEEWRKADSERLGKIMRGGLPNPMKAFLETQKKAAEAAQSKVVPFDPKKAN